MVDDQIFQRGYHDRDKRTRAIWFARERKTTEIPHGGGFVVLFEAATEIIHIHARTSTAHCRLVVAMLLIGGSYERDDRQVEISYHWLSAHYANIHSECQTDTISRSCLSRFAKAFLRLSLSFSLSLTHTFSLSFSLCTCNRCIRTHVVPFLELVVFHPFPIPSTFAKSYPHLRSRHGLSTRFRFEHDTRPPAPSSLNAFQTDVPARDSARCFGIPRWVRVTPAKFNYIGRSVATWIREIRAYKEEEIKNRKFSRGLLND